MGVPGRKGVVRWKGLRFRPQGFEYSQHARLHPLSPPFLEIITGSRVGFSASGLGLSEILAQLRIRPKQL